MKRIVLLSAGLILLALTIGGWLWWKPGGRQGSPEAPPVTSPSPEAPPVTPPPPLREVQPKATAVLPTLDTPIPEGKSAVWCASFQMAWERLKRDVTKGPVRLTGAQQIAKRLNDAPTVADTVKEEDVYTAGGFVRDGIGDEIRQEMARRFPNETVAELKEFPGGAVLYAYLRAAVKFTHPFLENARPLEFEAADGNKTSVHSFGLPYDLSRRPSVAKQIEILHATQNKRHQIETFVLDPSKTTSPYQVLVACIPRQPTLAAMLADVEKRIAGPNDEELTRPFRTSFLDWMTIPHVRFRITHHFEELEGKVMPDQGATLARALQLIDFRLDAAGATLTSQSIIEPKSDPRWFYAKRPFLIVMRKRGTTRPFFALWVENAELLEPWSGKL
jgi:hypothetical protein